MTLKNILRLFALFWIVTLSLSTLVYLNFNPATGFLKLKQVAVHTGWYLPAFYSHVFGSAIILLIGFFQFYEKIYQNRSLHRVLGKFYVFGVLFFASPGAYIMTFFINRGTGVFISFLLQNSLWVWFTLAAWMAVVKQKNFVQHIYMMRRSYALAFAAVTLRFYIWLFTLFGNGVNFENNYLIIAFLSWIPNLLLVELINIYGRKPIKLTHIN